jgi:hypothetical protein
VSNELYERAHESGYQPGYAAAVADIAKYIRAKAKLNKYEFGVVARKWHGRLVAIADALESGAWNGETQPTEVTELAQAEKLPIDFSEQSPIVPNVEGTNS